MTLERCPECKVFDRDQRIPAVRERVHRQRLGRTAPDVQKHKGWSYAVGKRHSVFMVKNTTVSELEFCRSRDVRPRNWNCRREVTKHLLKELGDEVTLVNHVDNQSAKA